MIASSLAEGLSATYSATLQVRSEEPTSWNALLERGRHVAAGLAAAGIGPGERVLLALPTSGLTLSVILGCFHAGVVPSCVSPPVGIGSERVFLGALGQLAAVLSARAVVAHESLAEVIGGTAGVPCRTPESLVADQAAGPAFEAPADAPVYVQLTSGTTRRPKAAVISRGAMLANARQIGEALELRPGDGAVSWLPLFHDMGLFGCVVTAMLHDMRVDLSAPLDFLRRPDSWLRTISESPAQRVHSAAPAFAYGYLLKRCKPEKLEGLDLSRWVTALVGAEPIPRAVLAAFEARLQPVGLSPTTLRPCYGLAEATLAVSITPANTRYSAQTVSRGALAQAGAVREPGDERDALELVGCGVPVRGSRVVIASEAGEPLPERALGEICVQGPNLFSGYLGEPQPTPAGEPTLRTGDLGFLDDGQLYVTGRQKDVIILRGHNHHPEEVEWPASQVPGVLPGRIAAFGVVDERGGERLCVMLEAERKVDPAQLELDVRRHVQQTSGLTIDGLQVAARGTLPLTTSGKVRRAAAREVFLAEEHAAREL